MTVGIDLQRRARQQPRRIVLFGPVVPQRPHLVANRGDHEDDCHDRQETDCLPEPLAGHPGGQLPQLAGEVNHHGQHQQRQRPAHQGAECADLHHGVPERPQRDRAEAEIGQPDRQQRDDREAEDSAAANPENPLSANGSPNTKSAITNSAADRLPALPSVVPL